MRSLASPRPGDEHEPTARLGGLVVEHGGGDPARLVDQPGAVEAVAGGREGGGDVDVGVGGGAGVAIVPPPTARRRGRRTAGGWHGVHVPDLLRTAPGRPPWPRPPAMRRPAPR